MANSPTIARMPIWRASANRDSAVFASSCMTPRSALVFATIRGRWIFTATSVPSGSVARWTWAVEAAANGCSSIVANSSSGGRPSSERRTIQASFHGNGSASDWSRANSVVQSTGRMSLRLAIIWPIFT